MKSKTLNHHLAFPYFSVDTMVDYYVHNRSGFRTAYEEILIESPHNLLPILKYEDNKPSKHDLMIIRTISTLTNKDDNIYKDILEVYKNRKD